MPQPLSLRQLVNEIDGHPEGWCCYVSRSTGEIVTIPNSDNAFLNSEDEEWAEDAERVPSDDFVAMPGAPGDRRIPHHGAVLRHAA